MAAAVRFAFGLFFAAIGIRYLYWGAASQPVVLTTVEKVMNLAEAERAQQTLWRTVLVGILLALGSLIYGYSLKVAVGGIALNLLASWIWDGFSR